MGFTFGSSFRNTAYPDRNPSLREAFELNDDNLKKQAESNKPKSVVTPENERLRRVLVSGYGTRYHADCPHCRYEHAVGKEFTGELACKRRGCGCKFLVVTEDDLHKPTREQMQFLSPVLIRNGVMHCPDAACERMLSDVHIGVNTCRSRDCGRKYIVPDTPEARNIIQRRSNMPVRRGTW